MAGKVRYLVQRGDGFWARIVVPQRLRPILGTTELREPLGPLRSVAERNLHAAVARFHARLAQAERQLTLTDPRHSRGRPLTLAQLARAHYAEELRLDTLERDYPDRSAVVDMSGTRPARIEALRAVASGRASNEMMAATIGWAIDQFRERGNVAAPPGSADWRRLARALAGVELDALERIAERDRGDDTGQPSHPLLTMLPVPEPAKLVSLTALFDGYLKELKASGKGGEAERRWRPVIRDFSAFLGHEDAAHITKADVLRWKEARLGSHSAKTVRDVYLAAVRAVFTWAADNQKLDANPAAGVKVRVGKPVRGRERGFTDAEARALLKAASDYRPKPSANPQTRESPASTAAKRWTPWLCAYTGARIAEMTQLRKEDVREQDGISYIRITPEAGSVKTGQYRDVPLHPHLIELGFLDFVAAARDGALFFSGRANPDARHLSKIVASRVSNWIRSLDVISPDVAPNHGWRHRFKTVGIEAGMHGRALDAIQGHAPRTAGDAYGDVSLRARQEAILKHPHYLVR